MKNVEFIWVQMGICKDTPGQGFPKTSLNKQTMVKTWTYLKSCFFNHGWGIMSWKFWRKQLSQTSFCFFLRQIRFEHVLFGGGGENNFIWHFFFKLCQNHRVFLVHIYANSCKREVCQPLGPCTSPFFFGRGARIPKTPSHPGKVGGK